MSNDFFNNHPILGSVFDFDHDGSISLGEASAMGAFGALYATEMMQASEEAEREANESPWDDDGFDDDDSPDSFGSDYRKKGLLRESVFDDEDLDATSRTAVMNALEDENYLGDIECLLEEALDGGVRFEPQDIIDLSYEIWDPDLLARLISTSKPRFLQEDANDLSPHWGTVELEYHEEAFDEESSEGNTYHMNTPEEDW